MHMQFVHEAEQELDEASEWYENHAGSAVADRFLDEVNRVSVRVQTNPRAWTEIETGVRQAKIELRHVSTRGYPALAKNDEGRAAVRARHLILRLREPGWRDFLA